MREKGRGHILFEYLYAVVRGNAPVSADAHIDTTFYGTPASGSFCFPAFIFKVTLHSSVCERRGLSAR
jgi:hypothetical protein